MKLPEPLRWCSLPEGFILQYGSVSSKNPKLYRLGNQKTNEDVGLRSAPPNLQLSLTVACFCGAVPYWLILRFTTLRTPAEKQAT
jgi:hypothetical protein